MLAKILEDMCVEPEVLEALSEEQKRILFLKMREEQVRRWKVREQTEARERRLQKTMRKKASSKHVSWLLGLDGDVSVSVIGDVDEFRSSKLLHSHNDSDSENGITTVDLLPKRQAHRHVFKGSIQRPITDFDTSPNESSEEDDPKDPAEDSDSESGSSLDKLGYWAPFFRSLLSSDDNQPPDTEKDRPQDKEIVCCEEKKSDNGGRVAHLRKAFDHASLDQTSDTYQTCSSTEQNDGLNPLKRKV